MNIHYTPRRLPSRSYNTTDGLVAALAAGGNTCDIAVAGLDVESRLLDKGITFSWPTFRCVPGTCSWPRAWQGSARVAESLHACGWKPAAPGMRPPGWPCTRTCPQPSHALAAPASTSLWLPTRPGAPTPGHSSRCGRGCRSVHSPQPRPEHSTVHPLLLTGPRAQNIALLLLSPPHTGIHLAGLVCNHRNRDRHRGRHLGAGLLVPVRGRAVGREGRGCMGVVDALAPSWMPGPGRPNSQLEPIPAIACRVGDPEEEDVDELEKLKARGRGPHAGSGVQQIRREGPAAREGRHESVPAGPHSCPL